jgi:hypothetical protein
MILGHFEVLSQFEISRHYLGLLHQPHLLLDLSHKHSSWGKADEIWFEGTRHFLLTISDKTRHYIYLSVSIYVFRKVLEVGLFGHLRKSTRFLADLN